MVDRPRVGQLLSTLAGYVQILRELPATPIEEFTEDPRSHGSAERFLQLAIETTLSVGHHVIAAEGLAQPRTCAEDFAVLGREGILDADLAMEQQPMARMRNRLVHHHEEVAAEQVHTVLLTRRGDVDRFADQVMTHLDRSDVDG